MAAPRKRDYNELTELQGTIYYWGCEPVGVITERTQDDGTKRLEVRTLPTGGYLSVMLEPSDGLVAAVARLRELLKHQQKVQMVDNQ